MTAMQRTWVTLIGGVLLAPLAALALFHARPGLDPVLRAPAFHFWVVSGTALAAAIASAVVIASARSLRETRLLFLALAFAAIAGIFSVHGLVTPGFLVDHFYASIGVSAWASIFAGAGLVALSAARMPPAVERFVSKAGGAIFAWAFVLLGCYVLMSIEAESWLDWAPTDERTVQYGMAFAAMALIAFAAWRYAQSWAFARLPAQAAIVGALVMLFDVPAILLWGEVWRLSWWMYHALYALAFVVLFAGWAIEVRRAGTLRAIADAVSMRDALAQLNRGRDTEMIELVDAIEAKDVATLGHVSRVAALALVIGRRMGISPADLRSLVLAAQLHDVGKIAVPDALLRKPGPLTDAEFATVKRHATHGGMIASTVPALRDLAPVIRAHHERISGRGYPDGLAGEQIPLLARIIAVADTYDAMTSDRPYRAAHAHEAAVAEISRLSGIEFDPRCVAALLASFQADEMAPAA
jgi:HD-GYP domain-containing protein (c-di-GMP phosphodiesterase class II)